ncbi:MAG: OsmC family protein [Blastocatellia bacterium]|jgi:peroxiredoxin-like protein|nr:OsmC family protein [Blastocatellia bacterium]MBK6425619.1 OsmC family protein [Blastocatellia bacterium]
MGDSHTYETEVVWIGERRGILSSTGLPDIQVAAPPEFKGHPGVWTPEHLFVSATASCFVTTFLAIAELSKLEFVGITTTAVGKLEKIEGQGYLISEIVIRPTLTVKHAGDEERALRILEKAERNCLVSNSIKSVVRLESVVSTADVLTESSPQSVEA